VFVVGIRMTKAGRRGHRDRGLERPFLVKGKDGGFADAGVPGPPPEQALSDHAEP
jgi:hypothetical protein